jgi:hypothetical protein
MQASGREIPIIKTGYNANPNPHRPAPCGCCNASPEPYGLAGVFIIALILGFTKEKEDPSD